MIRVEKKLKDVLYRIECPSKTALGEYRLGMLDLFHSNEIAGHLKTCPLCMRDAVQLDAFMALPLVPERSPAATSMKRLPSLEEIWIYVVDLLSPPAGVLMPAAAGPAMRGQVDNMSTRVFHVDPYIISLSALKETAVRSKQDIIGDIMPTSGDLADFHDWTAYLWRSGDLLAATPLEPDSHFYFEDVQIAKDLYDLILSGPKTEIHLQNLRME